MLVVTAYAAIPDSLSLAVTVIFKSATGSSWYTLDSYSPISGPSESIFLISTDVLSPNNVSVLVFLTTTASITIFCAICNVSTWFVLTFQSPPPSLYHFSYTELIAALGYDIVTCTFLVQSFLGSYSITIPLGISFNDFVVYGRVSDCRPTLSVALVFISYTFPGLLFNISTTGFSISSTSIHI